MIKINQTKDSMKSSSMYIGYIILKEIQKSKSKKVSIYRISECLKKNNLNSGRHLIIGLTFLHSLGIIDFEEPYICIN